LKKQVGALTLGVLLRVNTKLVTIGQRRTNG